MAAGRILLLQRRFTHTTAVKFQLISDTHVEFPKASELLPAASLEPQDGAQYLALLGDIGYPTSLKYQELLHKAADKFKKVFVIAGNHEYYNAEYYAIKEKIKEICAQKNNLVSAFTDVKSYVPSQNMEAVARTLNDYRLIRVMDPETETPERLRVDQSVEWFDDESNWLREQIALSKANGERVVVFTHHAPSLNGTSHPRFAGSPHNCAFASNLENLFGDPVDLWCFGHTHYSTDQVINGTRLVSNQVGYIAMSENSGFQPGMVVSVTPR